jgi:hypothetical protein
MTDREIMQQALDMLVEPHPHIRTSFTDSIKYREKINQVIEALRTALAQPEREWVGLTDDEIIDAFDPFLNNIEQGRAIEAKLKERNL